MLKLLSKLIGTKPFLVLILWGIVIGACVPLAHLAPSRFGPNSSSLPESEYAQVIALLGQKFAQNGQETTLLVTESTQIQTNASFKRAYNALIARVKTLKGALNVQRFDADYPIRLTGLVSGKNVTVTIIQTPIAAIDTIDAIRFEVRQLEAKLGQYGLKKTDLRFFVTGLTAITHDFGILGAEDAKRSELAALPIVALVLVLVFGALVAASIPILVGLISITVTLAALWAVSHLVNISGFALSVVTLLALGAGIDYALLMVNRFREELALGHNSHQAAANTTRTAGRAVLFSGLTVAVAMAALLVPKLEFVRAMGIAGVLVILVTILVSISAVPAALALLGERVNWPRLRTQRPHQQATGFRFWGNWAEAVMRHPWRSSLLALGFMTLLALPAFTMKLGYTGPFGLAPGVESRRGLELIRPLELGGALDTFELVIDLGQTSAYTPSVRAKFRTLDANIVSWDDVRLVASPFMLLRLKPSLSSTSSNTNLNLADVSNFSAQFLSADRRYIHLSIIPKQPVRATDVGWWIERLRNAANNAGFDTQNSTNATQRVLSTAATQRVSSTAATQRVLVGGGPVGSKEFTDAIVNVTPLAVGLVFLATFVLLGIAFRSILIPIKSIIMNTLTVGASYGVVTLVFQHGFLAQLFGAPTDVGVIDSSLPLVMFAITFGLSMDYEVFLLSRMQEAHLAGLDTKIATRTAIERTASVITSAALIMLIVFAAFIPGSVVANKVIGLGLTVAVLLDATIVRLVLVPAVMVMAGRWNWWFPALLKKVLPRINIDH